MKIKNKKLYFGNELKEDEIVVIDSLSEKEGEDIKLFLEDGFESFLCAPIFVEENLKAMIFFLHKEEGFFCDKFLLPFKTIIEQAPLAIRKAEFFEKMERNVAGLTTLQRTSNTINSSLNLNEVINVTVDIIMGTMGVSMAGLFLLDEQQKKLELVSSAGTLQIKKVKDLVEVTKKITLDIISRDTILITDDIDYSLDESFKEINLKSAVIIPLKVRGRTIGAIAAGQIYFKRKFSDADKRFLMTLANQIAIAIENATIYKQMKELATRDGLTKLYNHSYFQNSLKTEISKANRYERDLSLLIMDIDNFKDFNDTYGHQVGDEVLKSLARLLEDKLRDTDIVARYGGEEFAIILPETGVNDLLSMGNRVNDLVRNMLVRYDGLELKVTVSIGVANYKIGKSQKYFINAADMALYKAKKNGKDKCCLAE